MRFALVLLVACGGSAPAPTPAPPRAPVEPASVRAANAKEVESPDPDAGFGGTSYGGNHLKVVQIRPGQIVGSIDRAEIQRVVRQHMAAISACYDKLHRIEPDLDGKVITRWTIEQDGNVSRVNASGVHPDLEACIVGVITTFKFALPPGSSGTTNISYPFVFRRP